jgi:ribonuclease J
VYVPRRQCVLVKQGEQFWRTHEIKPYRVFPEELAERPEGFVLHVLSSTAQELITAGVLDRTGGRGLVVMEGYLKMPSGAALQELLAKHQISLASVHASGHASVFDLRRLIEALGPKRVVPIHSDAGDRFCGLSPRVGRHADGDWWQAGSK